VCVLTAEERAEILVGAVRSVIPDAVHGLFDFSGRDLPRVPEAARPAMSGLVGWSVLVFAVPITDDGLWVWHHHGEYRSLLANYVLLRAKDAAVRAGAEVGMQVISLTELTDNGISMVETGELAGLGTRGWNNLLLHPRYGSWLQIEAIATPEALAEREPAPVLDSVCIKCMNCINDCPADALAVDAFSAGACARLVAAPWNPRSRAVALTSNSYIECRECISTCPIGEQPEGIMAWQR
jgi:NAD-dependent dihydropyrimidine dehydrogenase PreA subunit